MSKPFTEDDLASQLTQDVTWRVKEISDLKTAVSRADSVAKRALLRAIVTIMYAHWEGHVRFSARKLLGHIALRKLAFSDLNRQFLRNHFLPRMSAVSQKSHTEKGAIVDSILDSLGERFSKVNDDLINTRGNLNFEVLADICRVCGIEISKFLGKETFIDIILLKRRNAIAHGEDTLIGIEELDNLADNTIALMRTFSNEAQMVAYLQRYKAC